MHFTVRDEAAVSRTSGNADTEALGPASSKGHGSPMRHPTLNAEVWKATCTGKQPPMGASRESEAFGARKALLQEAN